MLNGFWRNVSTALSGVIIAQLIPIVGSVFIMRMYSPSVFGQYSAWYAIVAFVSVILTLRFETSLAIISDGIKRNRAVAFSVYIVVLVSVVFFGVTLFASTIFDFYENNSVMLYLLIPSSLLLSLNAVWQSWAAAEGDYKKLTYIRVFQAFILVLSQISSGLYSTKTESLIISFAVSSFFSLVVSVLLMGSVSYKVVFSSRLLKYYFKRYRKFPLFSLPADVLNSAVAQMPVIIVESRFGADVAGYLALTIRVLSAPIGILGKAVLDVFKRHAVLELRSKGNCTKLYMNTFVVLSLASFVFCVFMLFLSEQIFEIVFGPEWKMSGSIAVWLLPMFALRFVASPLSYMVYIVERQYVDLYWQGGLFVLTLLSLLLLQDVKETFVVYSGVYSLMYFIYLKMSFEFSKGSGCE